MNSRLEGDISDFIFIESPKIILPISKAEKGTHIGIVTVRGKTKTFKRKQRVGQKVVIKKPEESKNEWQEWQQYYREKLYRPSVSSHEDYVSQSIMIAESVQHAKTLIRKYQAKDPSSLGVDLASDFEMMYRQTKDQVPKKVEKSSLDKNNLIEIKSLTDSGINIVGGIHDEDTYICKFKDGSSAIHKTMMVGDIAGEVGSYKMSKIIGWDIVPETIECHYGKGKGSSQKWIPDTESPINIYNEDGIKLEEKHLKNLSKIFIMDMITGNYDRHRGNIVIDENDKCWAIDNEMIGKLNNASLHIESLEQFVKSGEGSPTPMINVLENSFKGDTKMYQKFKDNVDKNLKQALIKSDEIIKYWSQYNESKYLNTGIPLKESIKNITKNIEFLKEYRSKL